MFLCLKRKNAKTYLQGLITPGKTVLVEATSGNMGIALASYAQIKGFEHMYFFQRRSKNFQGHASCRYKIVLIMPSAASIERRALMLAFGAEVSEIFTPKNVSVDSEIRVINGRKKK